MSAIEGVVVRPGTPVATFVDTGGAHPVSDYAATINWGDGTTSDSAVIRVNGGNDQVVSAVPHHYLAPGTDTVLVTIQDLNPTNPAATVADARLTEIAIDPLPVQPKSTPLAQVAVGSFFDNNSFAIPADFTATIDLGDGSPLSLGAISQPNGQGTAFVVTGNHTYTLERTQPYAVTVVIHD